MGGNRKSGKQKGKRSFAAASSSTFNEDSYQGLNRFTFQLSTGLKHHFCADIDVTGTEKEWVPNAAAVNPEAEDTKTGAEEDEFGAKDYRYDVLKVETNEKLDTFEPNSGPKWN